MKSVTMNGTRPFYPQCKSTKLSNVRSPADGEEQFPLASHSEEHYRRESNVMSHHGETVGKDCNSSPALLEDSTPAYFRWSQNLHNLLNDHDGMSLFKRYLKQECQDSKSLDFWFAVRGVKDQMDHQNGDDFIPIARLINSKIVHGLPDISPETKSEIAERIASRRVDTTIFDKAQKEVETVITKTTYPNFLRSDLYMQHIQQMQNSAACRTPERGACDSSGAASASNADTGPTSKADSNEKDSRDNLDILQTVYEDKELEIPASNVKGSAQKSVFPWNKSIDALGKMKPESQAGHYLKPNTPGYNSCYTKYAAYLPPSAQDSELQSSSDALTDDTMSIVSSTVDCDIGYCCKSRPAPLYEKQHKYMKRNAAFNKDVLPHFANFIPRTQRLPDMAQPSPKEFAAALTDKLNRVIEERRLEERLNDRLQQEKEEPKIEDQPFPKIEATCKSDPSSLFTFGAKSQLPTDTAQSILDEHVSRVFHDSAHQTASPSPGCLTPSVTQTQPDLLAKGPCSASAAQDQNAFVYLYQYNQYNTHYSNNGRRRSDLENFSCDSGTEFESDYDALHSASMYNAQRSHHSHRSSHLVDPSLLSHNSGRCSKDLSKRGKKPSSTDCGSSCFDSGISGIDVSSCSTDSRQRVMTWLDMKKYSSSHSIDSEKDSLYHKTPPASSPILGQSSKKSLYSSCRPGQQVDPSWSLSGPEHSNPMVDSFYCRSQYNSQPGAHNKMEMASAMDLETKRRLDNVKMKLKPLSTEKKVVAYDNSRKAMSKSFDMTDDTLMHRRSARKSCPVPGETTTIAYSYGRNSVPFLCRLPGKFVLLKQFKSLISKKGNFRYFFKTPSEEFGVVFVEISDDSEVLPIWEGKVFCLIEQIE